MNKYKIATLALGALLTCSSCAKFLDEDPKGQLTAKGYFGSQAMLDMALVGLYTDVTVSQSFTNPMYPQWQGDDLTAHPASNKEACREIDQFRASADNKGVVDAWNLNFKIFKSANFIINNAGATPTTPEQLNVAMGNAHFWRAHALFYLVRLFGPLPMNFNTETDDGYKTPLSSEEQVYAQIVSDLEKAEKLLPTSYTKAPAHVHGVDVFVTEQAVKSTLSAVYMAMAGYPLNKAEYYAKAADKAKEVIDGVRSGKYDHKLDAEWRDVYSMGNNYNKETILGINYSPNVSWFQDSQLPVTSLFESLGGWGDAIGEIRFWQRMPEGARKDAVYNPEILLKDGRLVKWWALKADGTPEVAEHQPMISVFTSNKGKALTAGGGAYDYREPFSTQNDRMTNDHRHRLIRYSEVLLWYAEAKGRSGDASADALAALNEVRLRAGAPVYAGLSADELAERAYDEHGWEVAGYYPAMVTRRADQFRMNRLDKTFAERAENAEITIDGVKVKEKVEYPNKTWSNAFVYLPYPANEAAKNPNLRR